MRFENSLPDKEIIITEMLSFVPLCVHENVCECLVLGNGKLPKKANSLTENIIFMESLQENIASTSEKFDIIISFDDDANRQEIFRILKKDGILCQLIGADIKAELSSLGEYYRIVMPYHGMKMVFASNKYHPTADLILDKSDFLEDNEYYNSDIHIASFAVYEKAKKALKGIAKN